jgi:holo-[acyl-carrier protein] synthase
MASIGCGIDVLRVDRFRRAMRRGGEAFLRRVFTEAERRYAARHHNGLLRLAARFAAKEAVVKALSQLDPQRLAVMRQVEIVNDRLGRPTVTLHEWDHRKMPQVEVSLSHEDQVVVACAIAFR